jgi:hypothetical protein
MKVPGLLLLVLLSLFDVSAQTSASEPEPLDLTVVKMNWRKEIFHPALTSDPFLANDQQAELQRNQKDNAIRNAVRVKEGGTPLPPNRSIPTPTENPDGPVTRFVYRVTVKNVGQKTITALAWNYLFYDAEKVELIGEHAFRQRVKIRPGKTVELVGLSKYPPTRVINAANAQSKIKLPEEISIREIAYEDGSAWQRPLP